MSDDEWTGDRAEAEEELPSELPDIPDAGDDSAPITSPYPIDFSTAGVTTAGAAGFSTFNDDDDRGLFERTVDVFEEGGLDSPMLGESDAQPSLVGRRVRIYES